MTINIPLHVDRRMVNDVLKLNIIVLELLSIVLSLPLINDFLKNLIGVFLESIMDKTHQRLSSILKPCRLLSKLVSKESSTIFSHDSLWNTHFKWPISAVIYTSELFVEKNAFQCGSQCEYFLIKTKPNERNKDMSTS